MRNSVAKRIRGRVGYHPYLPRQYQVLPHTKRRVCDPILDDKCVVTATTALNNAHAPSEARIRYQFAKRAYSERKGV